MRRGNQETLWKGSNIKMPFFFGVWLGRGQWDEFHHLASIQKGDYWALWCSLWNINRAGLCCRGLWRTALLFACKWAASNSMTTEAINNGGIGWNPCCKHAATGAQMQGGKTGLKTIISTRRCIFCWNGRKRGFCVKSRRSELTLCRLFVFLL